MSGYETPNNPTGAEQPSETGHSEQPTAYESLDPGSATSTESSAGDEGKTTSRVNKAAEDDTHNREEDELDDAGNGAGSDAGRPPRRNGDTGYAG